MTEKTRFILFIIGIILLTIIIYYLSILYFTKRKKENVFSVIGKVSICLSVISLISFLIIVTLINREDFSFAVFIYSSVNIIIYMLILDIKAKEIHDISCYDFPYKNFKEFKNHMRKELKEIEYEEVKLEKDITIYRRETPFLEARTICYVKELNKEIYKKVTKRIIDYFKEDYWLLCRKGILLSVIIYADSVEDYKDIVTKIGIGIRRGPAYITLPVVIDAKNKKLYICDNDSWGVPKQTRLAYTTLNHIYRTFLEETNEN